MRSARISPDPRREGSAVVDARLPRERKQEEIDEWIKDLKAMEQTREVLEAISDAEELKAMSQRFTRGEVNTGMVGRGMA